MRPAVRASVAILAVVLVGDGIGLAQPPPPRAGSIPMAIDKPSPDGTTVRRPMVPSGEALRQLEGLTPARRLELTNLARRAFGKAELRTLISQEPATVSHWKTYDKKGALIVDVTAFNARSFGYLLVGAELTTTTTPPDFASPSQSYLAIDLQGPAALYVASCAVAGASGLKYVFSRLASAGSPPPATVADSSGLIHYAFPTDGRATAVYLAAYGPASPWKFFSCTLMRAD